MTRDTTPEAPLEALSEELPEEADIAIIGGGLTGLCTALFLARQQALWTILLLESADASNHSVTGGTESGFHHRQIALAESSRQLFQQVGLWADIEGHCAAITEIQVSDRGHPGHSQLVANEQGLDAYGYVIDAAKLAALVSKAVTRQVNIQRVSYPTSLPEKSSTEIILKPKAEGMTLQLGEVSIFTQLAVLANGEKPEQARKLGVQFERKDYGRVALTTELTLSDAHRGIAYERFTSAGPIALLPLPDENGSPRASLVWTLEPEQAQQLLSTEEEDFIDKLQTCFGDRAGQIKAIVYRHLVPLSLILAREQVRSHLVLMGTAAHSLHPVAGQSFNLTLRDIAGLCEALNKAHVNCEGLGDLATLELYAHKRAADQQQVVAFSDALPALFSSMNPLLSAVRNMGLLGLELAPGLRGAVAQFGAGLAAREAHLND
ncbi:MAG: FAD-dependent oxidoreductase [Porticoccaceae bacterium]|nr:FAD-dependent oxidoreductase [Porticoccaceae bacterium]